MKTRLTCLLVALAGMTASVSHAVPGIPEPGLTLYGEVRNVVDGGNVRMITGTLEWTVQPEVGDPIVVTVSLRNINDQFSYVAQIPFYSSPAGFDVVVNSLPLTDQESAYTRVAKVNGELAAIVAPANGEFTFSKAGRGSLQRADLVVSVAEIDGDGDGLPDAWENEFEVSEPGIDDDLDGLTNLEEFLAGTRPNDATSVFKFVEVKPAETTGVTISWSSAEGRSYTLQRSNNVLTGYQPIQSGIGATEPTNTFTDLTATGDGPYFYQVVVEN